MRFANKIGVDLGTATLLIDVADQGIVIREPSVVAVQKKTGRILAVGNEAKAMIGRTPDSIEAIRPLREGVISDFEATEALLKRFLREVCQGWLNRIFKPTVMVCIPSVISPVERRAVIHACEQAGAGRVYLIQEPVAAALGAGIDIRAPRGTMVVDIGGGTTDVSIISLGEPVVDATIKVAGDVFDETIIQYVKRQHHLLIGAKTAEAIKFELGSVTPLPQLQTMTVRGRHLMTGLIGEATLDSEEIQHALEEPLLKILETIHSVLEQTPPELMADISQEGIILTGGGALLRGLDERIANHSQLQVRVAEDPVTCVVRGTAMALEQPEDFCLER